MRLDDGVDEREPEPRPLPDLLGREKRREEPGERLLVHADAGVLDGEHPVVPRLRVRVSGEEGGVGAHLPHREGQRPAPGLPRRPHEGHRVPGVHAEVQDRLLQLGSVGDNRRALFAGSDRQRDGLVDAADEQFLNGPDAGDKVQRLEAQLLAPRDRQQLPDEGGGPLDGLLDPAEALREIPALQGAGLLQPQLHQGRGAHDHAQDVVEIVRDPPGQHADGLHPLRLLELLVLQVRLGDVEGDAVHPERPGLLVPDEASRLVHPARLPAGVPDAVLDVVAGPGRRRRPQGLLHRRAVVLQDQFVEAPVPPSG